MTQQIDLEKLARLCGLKNSASARTAWSTVKAKLKLVNDEQGQAELAEYRARETRERKPAARTKKATKAAGENGAEEDDDDDEDNDGPANDSGSPSASSTPKNQARSVSVKVKTATTTATGSDNDNANNNDSDDDAKPAAPKRQRAPAKSRTPAKPRAPRAPAKPRASAKGKGPATEAGAETSDTKEENDAKAADSDEDTIKDNEQVPNSDTEEVVAPKAKTTTRRKLPSAAGAKRRAADANVDEAENFFPSPPPLPKRPRTTSVPARGQKVKGKAAVAALVKKAPTPGPASPETQEATPPATAAETTEESTTAVEQPITPEGTQIAAEPEAVTQEA